jgi:REP element-mobilizing transposase RayT
MTYNPHLHHRQSIRLKGYDYTQTGAYFVTICTYQRNCLFGEIVDGEMKLNISGEIAKSSWLSITRHFANVELDEFVIMPNHLHGIIIIVDNEVKQDFSENQNLSSQCFDNTGIKSVKINGTQSQSLAAIIQNYKSVSSRKINQIHQAKGNVIWQRNYYEHIIRNAEVFNQIHQYILNNLINWQTDQENPQNLQAVR